MLGRRIVTCLNCDKVSGNPTDQQLDVAYKQIQKFTIMYGSSPECIREEEYTEGVYVGEYCIGYPDTLIENAPEED